MKCKIVQDGYDKASDSEVTRNITAGQFDGRNLDHPEYSNANIFARHFFEYTTFVIRITENGGFTVEYGSDPYWLKRELGMDTNFWLRVVRESIEAAISRGDCVEVCPWACPESESDEDAIEWDNDSAYIEAE